MAFSILLEYSTPEVGNIIMFPTSGVMFFVELFFYKKAILLIFNVKFMQLLKYSAIK